MASQKASMSSTLAALRREVLCTRPFRYCFSAQRFKRQCFHDTRHLGVVKPFSLADIGEGITECQLIQWFVQTGARVEQFDKICEVQSDKASVEITSPFDGVIKKLHYEPDDMAKTGSPLVDIDIQGEIEAEDEVKLVGSSEPLVSSKGSSVVEEPLVHDENVETAPNDTSTPTQVQQQRPRSHLGALSTPAIRHLMKRMDVKIEDVQGTGRDGRVLKEDVQLYVQNRDLGSASRSEIPGDTTGVRQASLSTVQNQMFKMMTRSLSIPHFLYSCSADMTQVTELRKRINAQIADSNRITSFAIILKAVSLAFRKHGILNASLDTTDKPTVTYHAAHHFGIAVDTPSGLLVPVIHDVQALSINDIAASIRDLSQRAHDHKLSPSDFQGATFTVSNIGSIGGGVVSPVISAPQVAILGVGRSRVVPAFDDAGELYKKEELIMSWSADHRIVDGAECARCAEKVRALLEEPGLMLGSMR